jgi:hypothetical protein
MTIPVLYSNPLLAKKAVFKWLEAVKRRLSTAMQALGSLTHLGLMFFELQRLSGESRIIGAQ